MVVLHPLARRNLTDSVPFSYNRRNMITKENRQEIFKKHGKSEKDSGSTASQSALITARIKHLSGHLKESKKDYASQRGLLMLVGQRRRLLSYLKKRDLTSYVTILKQLDLRK